MLLFNASTKNHKWQESSKAFPLLLHAQKEKPLPRGGRLQLMQFITRPDWPDPILDLDPFRTFRTHHHPLWMAHMGLLQELPFWFNFFLTPYKHSVGPVSQLAHTLLWLACWLACLLACVQTGRLDLLVLSIWLKQSNQLRHPQNHLKAWVDHQYQPLHSN